MEAIKVLIVDDEHLERALIKLGTNWSEYGFEIVGEADSGQSALEKIKELKPEVVFTDICMPFMDGLELSSRLREIYPDIRVVIITGHREFEYAQRALRYGVTEFLLKPIKSREIQEVIQRLKNEIHREKEAVEQFASLILEVDWKELSFHLKNGIKDKILDLIDGYLSRVAELGNIEITTVRMLCTNIVSALTTVLSDMGKKISDIFEAEYDIYAKIGKADSLEDASAVLKDFAEKIIDYINFSKGKKVNELVERAKEYIEQNYTKEEIGLGDIAAKLFVNQSYLSRVFKVETGDSITEYISKLRINKSIEYITGTNLKVYEIAEKVGISDPHYFSICFKKYTGKSVNEYKKSINF